MFQTESHRRQRAKTSGFAQRLGFHRLAGQALTNSRLRMTREKDSDAFFNPWSKPTTFEFHESQMSAGFRCFEEETWISFRFRKWKTLRREDWIV